MKNVIISFASNYSYYELQPFVESWKNTQKAELYIFYLDLSAWTKDCLNSNGVHYIEVDSDLRNRMEGKGIGLLRMACVSQFLKNNENIFSQVAVLDSRDLVLQRELFTGKEDINYLQLSCESELNNFFIVAEWNTRFRGSDEWKKEYGDKTIINAGAFIGNSNEIVTLFDTILGYAETRENFFGLDQSILNYIVYKQILEVNNIILSQANEGDVVSIIRNLSNYMTEGGFIVRINNKEIPAVVHQYDRSLKLKEFVDKNLRRHIPVTKENYSDVRSVLECAKFYAKAKNVDRMFVAFSNLTYSKEIHDSCFFIANEILRDICDVPGFKADYVRNVTLDISVEAYSMLSMNLKVQFVDTLIESFTYSDCENESVIEKFNTEVISVIEHFSSVNDWRMAEKYVVRLNGLYFEQKVDYYILAARVYRNLSDMSKSKYNYNMACVVDFKYKLQKSSYEEYVDKLYDNKQDILILITVKDSAVDYSKSKNLKLEKLGIKANFKNLFRYSWLSVIDEGKVIQELSSLNEIISTSFNWNGNEIRITSAGFDARRDQRITESVSITLNGKELCMNHRGMNFVIIDKTTCQVIDSVAFDTYSDNRAYRKDIFAY